MEAAKLVEFSLKQVLTKLINHLFGDGTYCSVMLGPFTKLLVGWWKSGLLRRVLQRKFKKKKVTAKVEMGYCETAALKINKPVINCIFKCWFLSQYNLCQTPPQP